MPYSSRYALSRIQEAATDLVRLVELLANHCTLLAYRRTNVLTVITSFSNLRNVANSPFIYVTQQSGQRAKCLSRTR